MSKVVSRISNGLRRRERGTNGNNGTHGKVLKWSGLSACSVISICSAFSSLWPQLARCASVGAFLLLASLTALAQQRPLITEDVETVKPGSARFEIGFDFLQDKNYPVSGLNGDLTRLGVMSLTFGLAPNMEFETGGVVHNFLSINRPYRPSAIPLHLSQATNSTHDV